MKNCMKMCLLYNYNFQELDSSLISRQSTLKHYIFQALVLHVFF